ncbi:MAG: SIMPL domain-containing protein [Anaerolineae bacterium]|nr:SIMPL domain-containing protein [Anaerolineae bacterium]
MNKTTTLIAGLIVLLSIALLTGAQAVETTPQAPRLITVSGNAVVRVVPDEVVLTVGVENWATDLGQAKQENDRRVARLLEVAQAHGVAARHVQTDHISVEPRYEDGYEKRGFVGYFVRKTVVITLHDVSAFEDLLTSLLDGGATHVHGIQFQTTALRTYKDQARALAVEAAQEKAVAMAQVLGQRVGAPQEVREEQSGWWSWYDGWWGARWGSSMAQNVIQSAGPEGEMIDGTLAPGQIAVHAAVTVSFALQ